MSDIKAKNPVTGELETRDSDSWKTEMKEDGLYFLADHDMADQSQEQMKKRLTIWLFNGKLFAAHETHVFPKPIGGQALILQ